MQLFQRLNNEALDDDKKQNIRVINMMRKAMKERQEASEKPSLTPQEMAQFTKAYVNFKSALENQLFGEDYSDIGKYITRQYDTLMTVINGLDLFNKSNEDYKKINEMMDELIPNIQELNDLSTDALDAYVLPLMIQNIRDRNYSIIKAGIPDKILKKFRTKQEIKEFEEATGEKMTDEERQIAQEDEDEYADMPLLEDDRTGEYYYGDENELL